MVYSNKFVACILVNGRPKKELKNGTVKLEFGTEYALRLRNKNSRRALVKIYIDGENVSENGYVINANDYIDIKRHHDKDRAFKFVPLDSEEAVDFGKDGDNEDKEKGLIEARFSLEVERKISRPRPIHNRDIHHHHHHPAPTVLINWTGPPPHIPPTIWCGTDVTTGQHTNSTTGGRYGMYHREIANHGIVSDTPYLRGMQTPPKDSLKMVDGHVTVEGNHPQMEAKAKPTSDWVGINEAEVKDGCTVEGESTGQSFHSVWFDAEDTYTTLKIFLQGHGEYESEYEVEPVATPKKKRKTKKDHELSDLEKENEELRKQLVNIENQKLKEQIEFANKRIEDLKSDPNRPR